MIPLNPSAVTGYLIGGILLWCIGRIVVTTLVCAAIRTWELVRGE